MTAVTLKFAKNEKRNVTQTLGVKTN